MTTIRKSAPFVLAFLSLSLALFQFAASYSSGAWRNPSDEMVTKWEDHVRALREAMPEGVNQVGYMDDSTLSGDASAFDPHEFQLMQYSLAPVLLQMGSGREWIVGNFSDEENLAARLDEKIGLHEIREFGFGLYLIHDLDD